MAHRIRHAMKLEPVADMLKGAVQVDETYVGASRHKKNRGTGEKKKVGRGTDKQPVLVLVETDGRAHSRPIDRIDSKTLKGAMQDVIDPAAMIVTDEYPAYPKAAAEFTGGHERVSHSRNEYVNERGFHTNTAESFFALLKRGHYGVFHQISKKHIHRYCDEFAFRWNGRTLTDSERRTQALKQVEGKRLMYKSPIDRSQAC